MYLSQTLRNPHLANRAVKIMRSFSRTSVIEMKKRLCRLLCMLIPNPHRRDVLYAVDLMDWNDVLCALWPKHSGIEKFTCKRCDEISYFLHHVCHLWVNQTRIIEDWSCGVCAVLRRTRVRFLCVNNNDSCRL